ncbi:MAG: polysaccharide deacetylase family protein [Candidatus Riflebacteria bacterium]|nr:polysaccharide deacetylase family protein [Candidatus Riflebacteria bacterium]
MNNNFTAVRIFVGLLMLISSAAALQAELLTIDTVATGEFYQADRSSISQQLYSEKELIDDSIVSSNDDFNRPKLVKLLANTRKVVLTFDDGPHPRTTPKVLEILKRRRVQAIFFVLGLQAAKYPELVKQIHDEGHLIGNHSYSHKNLAQLSDSALNEELDRTSRLIESITGAQPQYLRPPYGAMNSKVLAASRQRGMKVVLWTIDPKDWLQKREASILQQTERQLGMSSGRLRGGALLLHDIYPSTVRALEPILDRLATHEYTVARINNLDASTDNFWANAAPALSRDEGFPKRFNPDITGHKLLISLLKPEQNNLRTPMAILKAHKTGNLLAYLIKNPCEKFFNQQYSL